MFNLLHIQFILLSITRLHSEPSNKLTNINAILNDFSNPVEYKLYAFMQSQHPQTVFALALLVLRNLYVVFYSEQKKDVHGIFHCCLPRFTSEILPPLQLVNKINSVPVELHPSVIARLTMSGKDLSSSEAAYQVTNDTSF